MNEHILYNKHLKQDVAKLYQPSSTISLFSVQRSFSAGTRIAAAIAFGSLSTPENLFLMPSRVESRHFYSHSVCPFVSATFQGWLPNSQTLEEYLMAWQQGSLFARKTSLSLKHNIL